ncbi:hypothetical protein ACTNDG_05530 [Clostridium sp. HCP1S3_B4]|uniref:hypothetical protein n=1 Tax=unclassified Clostridium TaxID=2614128 RepID=UPI0016A3D387|nr:hypothetical protein [Clostridiales bacterium]MDY2728934.1 hypothetical protein [Clostridium sp.]NLK22688.1 hypothetical protein [Clostridiales bacterium]
MAIKDKLPLKYAVDITEDVNFNKNYDIITLSLNKETYSQDEMAYLIEKSIDKIFVKTSNSYITLSKEEIHKIDITNQKIIIKIPVNYKKSYTTVKNKLKNTKISVETNENISLTSDDLEDLIIHSSQNTSSSYGYGLELI